MANASLNLRTDVKNIRKLDSLAEMQNRTRTDVVNEAIQNYIELQDWQIAEIDAALREADAGAFASDEEVAGTFKRLLR